MKRKLIRAQEYLYDLLSNHNYVPSIDVYTEAAKLGIGKRTIKKAKKNLNIISKKINNHWYYTMNKK